MRILILVIWLGIVLAACDKRKTEYTYYESGNVNIRSELLNGQLDGLTVLYYPSGQIREIQSWANGEKDGKFEFYFENGKPNKTELYSNNKIIRTTVYWKNGKVREIQYFDAAGDVRDAEIYKSNGERDSIPLPLLYLQGGDTLEYKNTAKLRGRIVNLVDQSYQSSQLIITSKFQTRSNGLLVPSDTIALIQNDIEGYKYEFVAGKRGQNEIHGIFILKREDSESIYVQSLGIKYTYFVE
jgi:hypothetical protein